MRVLVEVLVLDFVSVHVVITVTDAQRPVRIYALVVGHALENARMFVMVLVRTRANMNVVILAVAHVEMVAIVHVRQVVMYHVMLHVVVLVYLDALIRVRQVSDIECI